MNKELFDSMQKQMTPSPEVRAALSEKLAQPTKKRPVPWRKYGAVAACAALVIGAFSVYNLYQDQEKWMLITRNFRHDVEVQYLHSYVTVEGLTDYSLFVKENAAEPGGGDTGAPNTGDLPGGAYVGDVPVQEGAEAYQKLMDRFNGTYPDWYGGAYINDDNNLMVLLVESKDLGDKSLELQVLDWAGGRTSPVAFRSVKYSLAHLTELMDRLNALPNEDQACREFMAGWGIDEEANRIELTLTEVNVHILSVLAEMDPEDDAIYVRVGQRATTDSAKTEEPSVSHVIPGGVPVPDDEDLIADEPWYDGVRDGAHYDVQPAELPEQKQPAFVEDASTPSYDPDAE